MAKTPRRVASLDRACLPPRQARQGSSHCNIWTSREINKGSVIELSRLQSAATLVFNDGGFYVQVYDIADNKDFDGPHHQRKTNSL